MKFPNNQVIHMSFITANDAAQSIPYLIQYLFWYSISSRRSLRSLKSGRYGRTGKGLKTVEIAEPDIVQVRMQTFAD